MINKDHAKDIANTVLYFYNNQEEKHLVRAFETVGKILGKDTKTIEDAFYTVTTAQTILAVLKWELSKCEDVTMVQMIVSARFEIPKQPLINLYEKAYDIGYFKGIID